METLISQGAEAKIFLIEPTETKTPPLKKFSPLTNKNPRRNLAEPISEQSISSEASKFIIKDRIPKSYRIKILDDKIRKARTKSEKKLLEKASEIINTPLPQKSNDNFKIILPFIDGKKLSQHLDEFTLEKQKQILNQIGKDVAKLHDAGIIHGDLTTSNMILVEEDYDINKKNKLIITPRKKVISQKLIRSKQDKFVSDSEPIIYFIDFGLGFFNGKFEDKAVDLHLLKQALEAKHFSHWQENYQSFLDGYKNSKDYERTINQIAKVEKRGRYRH